MNHKFDKLEFINTTNQHVECAIKYVIAIGKIKGIISVRASGKLSDDEILNRIIDILSDLETQ